MRVVLNQLSAAGLKTGVGHYTSELLRCLRRQAGRDRVAAFPDGFVWELRRRVAGPNLGGSAAPAARRSMKARALTTVRHWARSLIEWHFRSYGRRLYDLYHEPNFLPLPSDLPTVITLHDLSVLLHPEWHPRERVRLYEEEFPRAVRRCVHFVAVSEFTRQEVVRVLGVAPERVTAVYNGVRPGLRPLPHEEVERTLRELGLPPRYLLCLGTIEPRKNVLRLLRAYCSLPPIVRSRWPLVLAGAWGWHSDEVRDYWQREARHRGVVHVGYVADEYLAALYNGARALAYPSHYEGFGLPPVEMQACGGAVLASTAGAVVETVGGNAHLIDAGDEAGWRDALRRVCTDDDWWQSLRFGVRSTAGRFTWERCAADTWQVYRSVAGRRTARRLAG
jgi:alpha-1,3-rhamnosyl/mannosyltransferase